MVHRTLYCLAMLTAFLGPFARADAESIAASLSSYKKILSVPTVAGVTAQSFSGVALQLPNRALFVVDNDNANVYELTTTGTVVRTVPTSGITDPEGIVHYTGDEFFLAEEGGSRVLRVKISASGTTTLNWTASPAITLGSGWGNSGLEGVGYCSANNTLYAVKEISPPRLYRIALDNSGGFVSFFANDPFNIESKDGDAADMAALNDGNFIIVNQERNRLEGYGPTGTILSTLSLGMSKPEGIAIDTADGTIYMVGEPREFAVFKKSTGNFSVESDAKRKFTVSIVSTGMHERPFAVKLTLPGRSAVSIDCILLDGRHFRVYESVMEAGGHDVPLVNKMPPGIRLFRFTAGPYGRLIVSAIP